MLVSEGRPEWMISDLSILANDAITVPNYTTYTQKDFEFVLKDADPIGLIVSSEKLLKTILDACSQINFQFKFIISFDKIEKVQNFHELKNDLNKNIRCKSLRNDPACIIYTSGTQGNPKGVVLSHGGIISNCEELKNQLMSYKIKNPRFITWLPLSHSYEHTVQFVTIALGAKIFYSPVIEKLLENIKIAKPHVMTAVPRFYNNLYNKMMSGVKKSSSFKKRIGQVKTIELGSKDFKNKMLSMIEKFINYLLNILVRKKVIKNFGGNLKAFVSGGGPWIKMLDYS